LAPESSATFSLWEREVELIPAIDLRGGRCVRLYQGTFSEETPYAEPPEAWYDRYAAMGARTLHVVDLDGARDGVAGNTAQIVALARRGRLVVQAGGGIRSRAALAALLDGGVARVVIGTLAVTSVALVLEWCREFGPDRLALALDVRTDPAEAPQVAVAGWQRAAGMSLWTALAPYRDCGVRHVLCTDIARDGALAGPNLSLYREAVTRCGELLWQASGGVRDAGDLAALAATGVAGAVAGRALLEDRLPAEELVPFWPAA
jgi:phosphoribosylformimino-5-aminoimidazole carboxamide ribotide isomerase